MNEKGSAPDLFGDVGEFHDRFGLGTFGTVRPGALPPDVFKFRQDFMEEELQEHNLAHTSLDRDALLALDALVDLVYVALGTAHLMGIDFNAHWRLVHEKNMQKERASGAADPRSKRGHSLDVVKPVGWTPPDHEPIFTKTLNDWVYVNERTDVE